MTQATILSIGNDALKYNLNVDDVVTYDHFSVYYDHYPNVVTNIENILCKMIDEKCIPVGKYIEVKLTDISMEKEIENIILLDGSIPKHVYEVIQLGTGYEEFEFNVTIGDKILIGGNPANDITLSIEGEKHFFVFHENIIAFYRG